MARRGKSQRKVQGRRIPVQAERDGSELCLQCGLCCDGTLFTNAVLKDGEQDYTESLGMVVETNPDGTRGNAMLPCPLFLDGCCSVYTIPRPSICGAYRCELLKAYVAGSKTMDEVLPVVHLVRSLARELEVEMGLPAGGYTRRKLQAYLNEIEPWAVASDTFTASLEHVHFLVAFSRMGLLGVKYFNYQPIAVEELAEAAGKDLARRVESGG
jgi:hypothetical protein